MNQPVVKQKTAPNLTSVTPAGPPPEPPEIDTTTPIDVSVIPFSHRDMPKWGAWLLYRLSDIWPQFTAMSYVGLTSQHMGPPTSLFIRGRKAILLAVITRETFDARPIADIVFCFKHHPDNQDEEKDVRLLFRHVENWAKRLGAKYVRILNQERVDSTLSRTKDNLWADEGKILLKDLDK